MNIPKYKRSKITPRFIKVYDELGLSDPSAEFLTHWQKVVRDEEKLRKVCETIYEDDFTDVVMDDLDLEKILEDVLFFGERGLGLYRGLPSSAKN